MPRSNMSTFGPSNAGQVELAARTYVNAATSNVTIAGLSSTYRQVKVQWSGRHDTNATAYAIYMRVNSDAAANYHGGFITHAGTATTPTSATTGAQNSARIGVWGGTTNAAASGLISGGIVHINSWNSGAGSMGRLTLTYQSQYYENGTLTYYENGGFMYNVAPPYTSLTFLSAGGNIQAGSEFTVYGYF